MQHVHLLRRPGSRREDDTPGDRGCGRGSRLRFVEVARSKQKKTPPLPCVTVPLNLLETGGTRRSAFDFQ